MFYISALEQLAKELEEVKSGNCEITIFLFHLLLPDTLAGGCDKHSSFFFNAEYTWATNLLCDIKYFIKEEVYWIQILRIGTWQWV